VCERRRIKSNQPLHLLKSVCRIDGVHHIYSRPIMSCRKNNKAIVAIIPLCLPYVRCTHRTRGHTGNIGLRGSPISKPTHHPTYPDWEYLYESTAGDGYAATNFPTMYPSVINSDTPTLKHDSPTYMPSTIEEVEHKNCESGTFFELDIALDYAGHDVTWRLVSLPDEVIYQGHGYKDGLTYNNVAEGCLTPGDYEFTIFDSGGDGIPEPGYYYLKLCKGSCRVIAGGNNFGFNETTPFAILPDGETAVPTAQPTLTWSIPPSTEYSQAPTVRIASSEDTREDSSFVDPFDASFDRNGAKDEDSDVDLHEVITMHSHENWVTIIDEDFENGFGNFIDEDTTAILFDNFEGRSGVIAIQDTEESDNSSLVSKTFRLGVDIGDSKVHSKFKVMFSYYTTSMENDDGF
jgi:hypothetical protein